MIEAMLVRRLGASVRSPALDTLGCVSVIGMESHGVDGYSVPLRRSVSEILGLCVVSLHHVMVNIRYMSPIRSLPGIGMPLYGCVLIVKVIIRFLLSRSAGFVVRRKTICLVSRFFHHRQPYIVSIADTLDILYDRLNWQHVRPWHVFTSRDNMATKLVT